MLYLNGHNYKYAAEQMLLSPRDVPSRGAPVLFLPRGKSIAPAARLWPSAKPLVAACAASLLRRVAKTSCPPAPYASVSVKVNSVTPSALVTVMFSWWLLRTVLTI